MFNDSNIIVANWPRDKAVKNNWGDKLNRELISKLSGLPVAHLKDVMGWEDRPVYRVIGSGLARMSPSDIIWGMGFIDAVTTPTKVAAQFCAVRGPKTRKRLMDLGVSCPDVYGDPALLYPLLYRPDIEQIYDYGIILHCREAGVIEPVSIATNKKVLHIDIQAGIDEVVQNILSCKSIISSSLHGIICAHAYGVPAYWLKASSLPLGDDFKFLDYFESVGCHDVQPTTLDMSRFLKLGTLMEPSEPLVNGARLIDACPFMSIARKRAWKREMNRAKTAGHRGVIFH
ncbi:polysaccharide pyruvyl transferase family protein [Sphingobium cupriresistens]|uniref:polysaccharide pyruvyl transferase family protein n=1 Tax=Sphingobium cupriresistens TaxID=1132417 RepID=UPI000AEE2B49|nr:polysaccharide pyruvyl transferase family protein [Sphingobium cupriresistens]